MLCRTVCGMILLCLLFRVSMSQRLFSLVSYCFMAVAGWLVLSEGFAILLLAGLFAYCLCEFLTESPCLPLFLRKRYWWVTLGVPAFILILVCFFVSMGVRFLSDFFAHPQTVFDSIDLLLNQAQKSLPPWVVDLLPFDAQSFKTLLLGLMKDHLDVVRHLTADGFKSFFNLVGGVFFGCLIFGSHRIHSFPSKTDRLASHLLARFSTLKSAFIMVFVTQFKIACVNACCLGFYVFVILPLFSIHLPLGLPLVVISFLVCLIPVAGNLISNLFLVVVSLSSSFSVAVISLLFMILIHKLEYFLSARFLGGHLQARTYELLLAMLLFESGFGLPGLLLAPLYYSYFKLELLKHEIV